MDKLFFHNRYDKVSTELLIGLPSDVLVIDVYGGDEVPKIFRISHLPYSVDKQLILETQSSYIIGTFTIEFSCRDYLDNVLTDEKIGFFLELDGINYEVYPKNGLISIELTCHIPKIIHLRLDGDGYWPWEGDIEVVENVA